MPVLLPITHLSSSPLSLVVPFRKRRWPRAAIIGISLQAVKMMVSMLSLISLSTEQFRVVEG
ncbi:hypothetical protein GmHk_08G022476 [Glycine max]|nr:hypothetical protein GmHk_08G022476 [Glycine max]